MSHQNNDSGGFWRKSNNGQDFRRRKPYDRGNDRFGGGNNSNYRQSNNNDFYQNDGNRGQQRFNRNRPDYGPRNDEFRGSNNQQYNRNRYQDFDSNLQEPQGFYGSGYNEMSNSNDLSPEDQRITGTSFHDESRNDLRGHNRNRSNNFNAPLPPPQLSEEDKKINRLVKAVQDHGYLGQVVVIQAENETPYTTLLNSLNYVNLPLNVLKDTATEKEFLLKIGEEEHARGSFDSVQSARLGLAEKTLKELQTHCFFMHKRKVYTELSSAQICGTTPVDKPESSSNETPPDDNKQEGGANNNTPTTSQSPGAQSASSIDKSSIAYKMMQKMGYSGGGLGAQEQGIKQAVTVVENITRQGLGTRNVMAEVSKILQDFAQSSKVSTLAFDAGFTKQEREQIHKLAQRKFGLKTKSEGKDEARRITVSKKISRFDLVKELLRLGGENEMYKLKVPTMFIHML